MSFSPEEFTLVRESIILPFLLPIIQKNLDALEGKFLNQLYSWSGKMLYAEVEEDIRKMQQGLRKSGIKVWENTAKREDGVRYYKYARGGNEDEMAILRATLKSDIDSRLSGYMSRLESVIQKG